MRLYGHIDERLMVAFCSSTAVLNIRPELNIVTNISKSHSYYTYLIYTSFNLCEKYCTGYKSLSPSCLSIDLIVNALASMLIEINIFNMV